jgi:hypothetical protein
MIGKVPLYDEIGDTAPGLRRVLRQAVGQLGLKSVKVAVGSASLHGLHAGGPRKHL